MTTLNCGISSPKVLQNNRQNCHICVALHIFFAFDVENQLLYTQSCSGSKRRKKARLSLNAYLKDVTACLN